jgi:hypothetical protein
MAKVLFHLVMGLLTGGLWWVGLVIWHITKK